MYRIIKEKCSDCGYCNFVCPFDAIIHHVEEKYYEIDQEKCKQCGQCYKNCIASVIECDDDQECYSHVEICEAGCIGCSLCSKKCPVHAISGELRGKFHINQDACIQCGECAKACPKNTIICPKERVKK